MSTDVIGPVQTVGSGGSSYAFLQGWAQGSRIQKIETWTEDGDRIKALKLYLWGESDEQAHLYGQTGGTLSSFTFQQGEYITTMSLWAGSWNGNAGTRAGYISFNTSLNNSYNSSGGGKSGNPVVVDVYSGVLVGAELWYGDDINVLGFAFLRPIISCTIQNVSYPANLPGSLAPEVLDSLNETNNGSDPVQWSLTGTKEVEVSSSWSTEDSLTLGMSVSVTAGVPVIDEVSGSFNWGLSQTTTTSSSTTDTQTLSWSQSGTLQPGQSIDIEAMVETGTINVPYSGTMVIVVDNGDGGTATLSYPVSGTYAGVSVSDVQIVVN